MRKTCPAFLVLVLGFSVAAGCGGSPPPEPATVTAAPAPPPDPLPSWNDGSVKRGLLDFVARVTQNGADLVPLDERIAVFDNDGTLWQEKPVVEGAFTLARLDEMAKANPALREKQPFEAALDHDAAMLREEGLDGVLQIITATHTGMTDDVYRAQVLQFLATARHPRFKAPYTSLTYLPMLELLRLLRANGFTTYICSGGDVDFMRVFATGTYGIPPEHVIGTRFEKKLMTARDGKSFLLREPKIESINDKETKPIGIDREIGKRPIFAAGNVRSGGDIAMLRYTHDVPGSFQLVINHDDAERESAYAEKDGATLAAAKAGNFSVVSMKNDWKVIFPPR